MRRGIRERSGLTSMSRIVGTNPGRASATRAARSVLTRRKCKSPLELYTSATTCCGGAIHTTCCGVGDPHRWYSEFCREHGRVKLIRVRRREWEWRRRLSQKGAVVLTRVDVARLAAAPASLNELWAVMWHVSRPKTHSSDVAPSSRRLGGHNGPTRRRWSGSDTPGSWERCLAPQAILNDELLLNHGRSHGQVTLPPCQRGWVGPRDRSAPVMLRRSSGQCCRFVRDLRARCLVVFGRWCVEEAGLFFVKKENRKLRLILDVRRANTRVLLPPPVELVSAEGLSRIELDMSDGEGLVPVFCGNADGQDQRDRNAAFPILRDARGSSWWCEWVVCRQTSFEPGWHAHPHASLPADGVFLVPVFRARGRRGGRQRCVAQSIAAATPRTYRGARSRTGCGRDTTLHLRRQRGSVSMEEVVAQRLEEVVEPFERRGLKVHERELRSGGVEALGVVLDGQRQHTRLSRCRFWKVRGTLLALTQRRHVSARQVVAFDRSRLVLRIGARRGRCFAPRMCSHVRSVKHSCPCGQRWLPSSGRLEALRCSSSAPRDCREKLRDKLGSLSRRAQALDHVSAHVATLGASSLSPQIPQDVWEKLQQGKGWLRIRVSKRSPKQCLTPRIGIYALVHTNKLKTTCYWKHVVFRGDSRESRLRSRAVTCVSWCCATTRGWHQPSVSRSYKILWSSGASPARPSVLFSGAPQRCVGRILVIW